MEYSKEHVAACLRAERARVKESRDVVAAGSGVPASTLETYENEKVTPSLENAWKLANYYGKSLDALFERDKAS